MGKKFRYDAFISYRHCSPDSEIAEHLQKKLESFRLPKDIAEKTRKTRPLRVFRDETELSVADDLSDAITSALWDSKYLICVCSPEYLKSVWCMKEIEAFLRFNDRKHILLVLADGEPDTAFPEVLLYEEVFQMGPDGHPQKTRQYKEPLAADCRGDSLRDRKAKVEISVVRLVAVIKNISYEELSQRHRKEAFSRARNRVLAVFGVLLAIIAVCVFFIIRISDQKAQISRQQEELQAHKDEIEAQKNTIQQKYEDSIAGISENLLRDGKRKDAVYAARSVLPDNKTEGYSDSALKALSGALGIYEFPDLVVSDDSIQFPCAISNYNVSPFGGYIAVLGLDQNRFVMDVSSGKMLLRYQDTQYADCVFDGDRGVVFQRDNENYKYLDFASGTETDLGLGDVKLISDPLGNGYASITDDEIVIFRGPKALCRLDVRGESLPDTVKIRSFAYVFFSIDGNEAWIFILDQDSGTTYIYSADLLSGSVERRYTDHSGIYDYQSDGKSMLCLYDAFSSEKKLLLKDLETGEEKRADWKEAINGFQVFGDDVVIHDQTKIYYLNRNLEVIRTIDVDVDLSTSVLTPDGIAIFDLKDGCYLIRNGECRFFDPDVDDAKLIWSKDYADGTLFLSTTGNNQIDTFSYRETDYLKPYADTPVSFSIRNELDDPEIPALEDKVMKKEKEFSRNMIYEVIMCENADYAAFQLWDGEVCVYSRSTGDRVKTLYPADGYVWSFYYDASCGNYYIGTENSVEVFDSEFRSIGSISGCRLSGYDGATGHPVVMHRRGDELDYYLVVPVSYEELLSLADDLLSGYEPGQRVREKYGLS
ncbi:MAG: toll/interleukin-1 receptor domain-containing protein [Saccharofermentanaceae bacterium]|nr:toll/interleukin-1 receptor domain-containing protein [Saccharofermentanaceae bacterium]